MPQPSLLPTWWNLKADSKVTQNLRQRNIQCQAVSFMRGGLRALQMQEANKFFRDRNFKTVFPGSQDMKPQVPGGPGKMMFPPSL